MDGFRTSAPRSSYSVPYQSGAEQHSRNHGYGVNDVQDHAGIGHQSKSYYSNVVNGGNVQLGDRYYFSYEKDPDQQRLDWLLESLSFPEQRLRANQISDSYPETFEWSRGEGSQGPADISWQYLKGIKAASAQLVSWFQNTDPVYWIYGKPGSGKSTLMKFLATHETTRHLLMTAQPHGVPKVTILTHYFWLSGNQNQRSLQGCLASLLHQICGARPQLVLSLVKQNDRVRNVLDDMRSFLDWSTKDLKYLFLELTKMMTNLTLPCCVFVDGIDEYDKHGNIDDFLIIIEQLTGQGIQVCLSSRPEPHIQECLSCYPKLRLQDVTNHDMATLVLGQVTEAVTRMKVLGVEKKSLQELARQIVDKAEGVFLWACLAVKNLVGGLRNGDSMAVLERRLRQLPSGIKSLYQQMLSRVPPEDQLLYRGEASVFLAMAEHLPMSLLSFTVAMGDRLQERILGYEELNEEFLGEIMDACMLMEKKLHSRTGGLLTCVRNCEPERPPLSWDYIPPAFIPVTGQADGTNAASLTDDGPFQDARCCCSEIGFCSFDSRPLRGSVWTSAAGPLEYMHNSTIALLHRSAAEFIFAEDSEVTRIDTWSSEEARRRECASIAAVKMLGCACTSTYASLERCIDYDMSDAKITQLFRPWIRLYTQPRSVQARYSCPHGFHHADYVDRYMPDETGCLDFLGLAAYCGGYQVVIDALQDTPGQVGSYYKGYLVICAARGLRSERNGQYSKVTAHLRLINWLIVNDANLLTPHVIPLTRKLYRILVARSPVMECWLLVLRLAQGLGASLRPSFKTQELNALLIALTRLESMSGVPLLFVVGSSAEGPIVDLELSADVQIVIEVDVNDLEIYCAARLTFLQGSGCTTGRQSGVYIPLKLSQIAKTTYKSFKNAGDLRRGPFDRRIFRQLPDAEAVSLLDAVEETLAHNSIMVFPNFSTDVRGMFCGHKPKYESLRSILADHGRRIDMTYYEGDADYLVPPDLYRELDEQTWYEQGELRERILWRKKV